MKKVEAVFLMVVMLSVTFIMLKPQVAAQSGPVLIKRGQDYETWQLNATHFMWVSAPPWVWDGSKYVPYIFEDHYAEAGYYLMRNAYIAVRLYSDHAEFWDANYTEVRVEEEKWLAQHYEGEGWYTLDVYNPSLNAVTNSSGIFITQYWDVGPPIDSRAAFSVTYALREARPLEHFLTIVNKGGDAHEFRLVQSWDGIIANSVKHSKGETRVTSSTSVYSLWFQFTSDTNDFVVFENLWSTGYYDKKRMYHNDVLQPTVIGLSARGLTATFTYSNRSLYTLGPGESLQLDPETWTHRNEYDKSGYIVAEGYTWWPAYKYVHCPSFMDVGKEFEYRYGLRYYMWYRGYVSFDTSSIEEGADIQSAELQMYLIWIRCEDEDGGPGQGFFVDWYSGKDQWTQLTTDNWDSCSTWEAQFYIDSDTTLGYYYHSIDPSSIALRPDNQRTQFRFSLYNEIDPPEGRTAHQRCAYDNPYDDYPTIGGAPWLNVIYTLP